MSSVSKDEAVLPLVELSLVGKADMGHMATHFCGKDQEGRASGAMSALSNHLKP